MKMVVLPLSLLCISLVRMLFDNVGDDCDNVDDHDSDCGVNGEIILDHLQVILNILLFSAMRRAEQRRRRWMIMRVAMMRVVMMLIYVL